MRHGWQVRAAGALLLAATATACGQDEPRTVPAGTTSTSAAPTPDPVADTPFAVAVPGREEVTSTALTYAAASGERTVTVHRPASGTTERTVLVVQGPQPGADQAPPVLAWARLLAAGGAAVVLADYGGTEQVAEEGYADLRAAWRRAGEELGTDRLDAVLGLSAGGPYAVRLAGDLGTAGRAAFLYARVEPTPPAAPADPAAYSLTALLRRADHPRVLVAYGEQDTAPGILAANRRFAGSAAVARAKVLRHPGGHAFELTTGDAGAARLVERALAHLLGS